MSKTRVYELAKTLEISNKELLEKLKEMGIEAKSHSSGLEEEAVNRVLNAFAEKESPKAENKTESKSEVKTEKKPEHKQEKKTEPKQEKKNAPKQEKKAERKTESEMDMLSEDEVNSKKKKKKNKKNKNKNFNKPAPVVEENTEEDILEIQIADSITVKDLAEKINKPASAVIMQLMKIGVMASANQEIDFDTAEKVCENFDIIVEKAEEIDLL